MSKISNLKIIFLTLAIALILSSCSISFNTGGGAGAATDGGIYKSLDKGTSWKQKVSILTVGAKRSFASVDIVNLTFDPQDNKAIYAGSIENGLLYSYDGGEGWQIATNLGKVMVLGVAIDPVYKCVIYAVAANKVYKSSDCSRTWSVIYYDSNLAVAVTSVVVDYSNNNIVYIGTSRGEIIKSTDRGASWQTLFRFDRRVDKIIINPVNAKNIFVLVSNFIFRSVDSGASWTNLQEKLKDFNGSIFRDFIIVKAEKPTIFLATNYGLIKSTDNGDSWLEIKLIPPKNDAKINSVVVNPFDANEIYYVTDTTFYRSLDGGKNWTPSKLPTSRAGWKLAIDPKNPSIIYLATKLLKK